MRALTITTVEAKEATYEGGQSIIWLVDSVALASKVGA